MGSSGKSTAGGALGGAAAGASIGSIVPGIGTAIGAGVGALAGGIFGTTNSDSSAPQLAVDPNLVAEQQQAQKDQVAQLQTEAQGDTAALMSRYGTRLALAGSTAVAPLAAPQAAA